MPSAKSCFLFPGVSGMMWNVDWVRLGRYVIAGRIKLGYRTREPFATALGISARVLGDIETGRRGNYDPTTLASIENVLGWETGSIDGILRGGEPRLTSANTTKPDEPVSEDKVKLLRAIAENEDRSPGLRAMAKLQAEQIEAILEAARAEENASRRRNAS